MSTALRYLDNATIITLLVENAQTVTKNRIVQLSANGIRLATAGSDTAIGVARDTVTGDGALLCDVTLFGPVEAMIVGTGGVTAGVKVVNVSDGVTDAPAHDADGTTNDVIMGVALETGIATQLVGVMLALGGNRGSA